MTLLEAAIAVVMVAGITIGAVEASRSAITRDAFARLQVEATLKANTLLANAGTTLPLRAGRHEGMEERGIRWALDISSPLDAHDRVKAFEVVAEVAIARGGLSARSHLATLKLFVEPSP